ncbi:hypothetical protein B0H14DRAFT_3093774 [Mycena olivaceomarginata]|nr:hypothetical protein B0H14DRAFT_3093774 [Mycena olivaceomarginata]
MPSLHRLQAPKTRACIVDAICADGGVILMHRSVWLSNDAVQRCLEAATGLEERRQIVACMRKITEPAWTPPAPPIFAYYPLEGKWTAPAYHETGSLDGIIDDLLAHGAAVFGEVAKSQWGSYCIQHKPPNDALEQPLTALLHKSVVKALEEGGNETVDRVLQPARGARRAIILIASVLLTAKKDRCAVLYDCIRAHIVTLRACKTGSKVIWLFDRMGADCGH